MRFTNYGYCYCCDKNVQFTAKHVCFRDHYLCSNCGSVPKERALMYAIEEYYPNWRELKIFESSPVWSGASKKLRDGCAHYNSTKYYPEVPLGEVHEGFRNENLEKLTYADEFFDLMITSDVMEHVYFPDKAFAEFARVLKPGGAHIFVAPIVNKKEPTFIRSSMDPVTNKVSNFAEPEYHGDAIVTRDWGYDICQYILKYSGLFTQIFHLENLEYGLKAEHNDVFITFKPKVEPPA
jgi:SAM-dependent methyltransferase